MCSIVLINRLLTDTPLLVAANRDEKLDRPASGPRVETDAPITRIRPVDESQGGTWLGLNAMGVFAGITNRFMAPTDPQRHSRGSLPLQALEEPSARMAANRIASIDPSAYNAFHLVMADPQDAWVVWSDGAQLQRENLLPGIHVITESSYGAGEDKRRAYLLRRAREVTENSDAVVDDLRRLRLAVVLGLCFCLHLRLDLGQVCAAVERTDVELELRLPIDCRRRCRRRRG